MAGVFSDKVKKAEKKDSKIKDLRAKISQLAVASRTVVWLSLEKFRFQFVPVFHGLQGRLAA